MEPYFKTKLGEVYHGFCLEVMKQMPNNSVDSIITDPPYALEFMGKSWDKVLPNAKVWQEALRIAKPGTILMAFGGTRTYHRLTCAIEDAGWEIRDCIMWVYGCLSEDTEILTTKGWERYHEKVNDSSVLCYDIAKDEFIFDKPLRSFCYENKHTAYRIKSDFTDQIVSKNHRCIVERKGSWVFQRPETWECEKELLKKQQPPHS